MRLTNLADVLRAAGLPVIEVDDWQTRGRKTNGGQYLSGHPNHVMVHHTAGSAGASSASEVQYMTFTSSVAPIANLYIGRAGDVWVMAGGPSNTNGSGSAPWYPGGISSMNAAAIGIEIGNNGVGESYPTVQQDAVVTVCAALCNAYNISVDHVRAHFEWAPGRKIDPSGPSRWAAWGQWNMDAFRHSVNLATETGDDVIHAVSFRNSDTRAFGQPLPAGEHRFGAQMDQLPAGTKALNINVTVLNPAAPGFVAVWTKGAYPDVSLVNHIDNRPVANATTVALDNGHFMLMNTQSCDLIVDVISAVT